MTALPPLPGIHMSSRFLLAVVVGFSLAVPAYSAEESKPVPVTARLTAQPADALAALLDKLHGEEVELTDVNLNETPLFEILQRFAKRYDLTFSINEESFKAEGLNNIRDALPGVSTTQVRGLTIHQFLTTVLHSTGATYMVKGKTIEIVAPGRAARLTRSAVTATEDGRTALKDPLVSAVFKEKPLNEAVAALAEHYDLTAIVSQQAGDARTGFITARLLNVPADRALELVALQADLRVVRKGAAFLITSREHADALFQEEIEKQRARIELDKFRQTPPPRPEAPAPQPNPDQTVFLKFDLGPQLKPQK
jgi:hypothetical protein